MRRQQDVNSYGGYQPIQPFSFDQENMHYFEHILQQETRLLGEWQRDGLFCDEVYQGGFELESWLVDNEGIPVAENLSFIKELKNSALVPEVIKSALEINSPPCLLGGDALSTMHHELTQIWQDCTKLAEQKNLNLLSSGTLMSGNSKHIEPSGLTPSARYRAIDQKITTLNRGNGIEIDIQGRDKLAITAESIGFNGLSSSFQIHMRIPQSKYTRFYNASLIASAPILAISTNSPFLLGHELWEETRIATFEQTMKMDNYYTPSCANFGSGYLQQSITELYEENYLHYPRLLPEIDHKNINPFHHLSRQNSVAYRWSRPVVDFDSNGTPHLRIEFRPLPSGPTIIDMMANAAFYYGLVTSLANDEIKPEIMLSFIHSKANFYCAAKEGSLAHIKWLDGKTWPVNKLIQKELVPRAREGLAQLGFHQGDIRLYLGIIEERAATMQTGSYWQRQYVNKHGKNFEALVSAYAQMQNTQAPVHTWSL